MKRKHSSSIFPLLATASAVAASLEVLSSSTNDNNIIHSDNTLTTRYRLREHRHRHARSSTTKGRHDVMHPDDAPSTDGSRERQHISPRLLLLKGQSSKRNGNPRGINIKKKIRDGDRGAELSAASRSDRGGKKISSNMQYRAGGGKPKNRGQIDMPKKTGTARQRQQNQEKNKKIITQREKRTQNNKQTKTTQQQKRNGSSQQTTQKNKRGQGGGGDQRAKKDLKNRYGGGREKVDNEVQADVDEEAEEDMSGNDDNKYDVDDDTTSDNDNGDDNGGKPKVPSKPPKVSSNWEASWQWVSHHSSSGSKSGKRSSSSSGGAGSWQRAWVQTPSWPEKLCECSDTPPPSWGWSGWPSRRHMTRHSNPLNPVLSGGKANRSERNQVIGKRLLMQGPPPSWHAPPPPGWSNVPIPNEHNGKKALKHEDWAPAAGDYGWSPGWDNVPGFAGTAPLTNGDWGGSPHPGGGQWYASNPEWQTPNGWKPEHNGIEAIKYEDWAPAAATTEGTSAWDTGWDDVSGWDTSGWDAASDWGGGWWTPEPTLCPCLEPTLTPTRMEEEEIFQEPTLAPTMNTPSPTVVADECNWFYWGGDEGKGGDVGENTETPAFQSSEVIDLSAGSRHSFVIDEDGVAYVAGFIESFYSYVGHMGVDRNKLKEGGNDFQQVDTVINTGGSIIKAPKFHKVYAGAGAPGNSRNMHSLLIDAGGNVYTTGNNNKGQLCQGDLEDRDIFTRVSGINNAVAAGVGLDFTLILLSDGKVVGCGSNENGELGLGPDVAYTPTPDGGNGLSNIAEVSAGLNFGLYLQKGMGEMEGKVFGSGSNLFSQLCESTEGDPVLEPLELAVGEVSSIAAGKQSSYYLYSNGSAKSCGRNNQGQLADGTFNDSNEPVKVDIPKDIKVHTLGSGSSSQSVFFVADEDKVYAAGQNYRFQLGTGEIESENFPIEVEFDDGPTMHEITKISSSGTHTLAISCELFTDIPTMTPTQEPTLDPTEEPTLNPTEEPTLAPSEEPTLAPSEEPTQDPTLSPTEITEDPTLSPTDAPTLNPSNEPTLIPTVSPSQYPTESPTFVTPEPTLIPTEAPTLNPSLSPTILAANWFYWGADEGRGLPLGQNTQVPLEIEGDITDVSAGSRHTFLIELDGTLQATGFIESDFGYLGHLGLGPVDNCGPNGNPNKLCQNINDLMPIEKVVDASGKMIDAPPFIRVYAGVGVPADSGQMHSLVISRDGKAYVTGNNNKGQLCLGGLKEEYVDYFHEVKGINNAIAGAVGDEFTLILTEDGEVWGCGTNSVGQLGLGDDVDYKAQATKIDGLSGITDLATGLRFAMYLNGDDDKVWGSGANIYGEQCMFTEGNPVTTPQEVSKIVFEQANRKVIQVEASQESSYFLYDDGTVKSCGINDEGQLGNGDFVNTSQEKPIVKVDIKEKVRRLGSGPSAQSVFFIADESVWASGINDRFQLGIDKIGSRDTPVKVEFDGKVAIQYVSASGTQTVANGKYLKR